MRSEAEVALSFSPTDLPSANAMVSRARYAPMMPPTTVAIIERVLARAPQWVRHDLVSNDPSSRQRAEEALAAMIAEALANAAS